MRVFIGSSGENKHLVEWVTGYIQSNFRDKIEPVPWTASWPGGQFILEHLQSKVEQTDASILFLTRDDRTDYRGTARVEPRDNLTFEAGLFIAGHGRDRTQLFVQSGIQGSTAMPTDLDGLTRYQFYLAKDDASEAEIEASVLPKTMRTVCNRLLTLGTRNRQTIALSNLIGQPGIERVTTLVGDFTKMANGLAALAEGSDVREVDVLAVYRVGEIRRRLDGFKKRREGRLRACFANLADENVREMYLRKYTDREPAQVVAALKDSILQLIGRCNVDLDSQNPSISDINEPPIARYDLRLTSQRITFGYYRVNDLALLVPLDMKMAQNPSPPAWLLDRRLAPIAFDSYQTEFEKMFQEARSVYPTR